MNGLITSRHDKNAVNYYDEIDDYDDDYSPTRFDEAEDYESGSYDSPLYGGLPYGDSELFLVDNEDLIDQMDF